MIQLPTEIQGKPFHSSTFLEMPEDERKALFDLIPNEVKQALNHHWPFWARPEQLQPPDLKYVWLILAGRGWGKTRTGAEWVNMRARSGAKRIALIAETQKDLEEVMVEGESGILATAPPDFRPIYTKKPVSLVWPNGCVALGYNGTQPGQLRGPQFDTAWADEIAKWRYAQQVWDMLSFCMRLGDPKVCVTTTPRPTMLVNSLVNNETVHVTLGSTYDNRANLAKTFFDETVKAYEGTRLGQQELHAQILNEKKGALWNRVMLDENRIPQRDIPPLERIVVAIDPAISSEDHSDEHGIIVAGVTAPNEDGEREGIVLEDASCKGTPGDWARAAAACYNRWEADAFVAEVNQGGDMVEHTLRTIDSIKRARVIKVHATKGKALRAEPVAALYEQGHIRHAGRLNRLEDQMVQMTSDFNRDQEGYSPDRVDALVWALTDLFPRVVKKAVPAHSREPAPKRQREF